MKRFVFAASVLVSSVCAFAQHEVGSLTFQPKVGLNIANYTGEDDTDPRYGLAAGAEFEYQVSKMLGLSAGVVYSMQGAKQSGTYDGIKAAATMMTDYVNLPVMANIYVAKGIALKFGVQPAFNVRSDYEVSAQGISVSGSLSQFGIDINSFDFAIPVGLSFENSNVVLDARYNIGVMKMVDGDDTKNSVFQFTFGYKFSL